MLVGALSLDCMSLGKGISSLGWTECQIISFPVSTAYEQINDLQYCFHFVKK